ncbi:MAG: bifunctional chorismate mutase/prephenate dehydratase [Lachnospiraceae bacterium]|nr:bifunctional chorismate mutase/prephenate dehydratase [Lachnospiraceae bacterium]
MDLSDIREQLDECDSEIVRLFEKRMALADEVATVKLASGKAVLDKERENAKLARVSSMVSNEVNAEGIKEVFKLLMSISRKFQYKKLEESGRHINIPFIPVGDIRQGSPRVVFQGDEGAYSQIAMKRYFGDDVSSIHVPTFRSAMMAISEGSADYAVLPIENTTAGIVNEIYDLLAEYENYIVAEQVIRIEHCLMGVKGADISDISTVFSHPQSLMQSSRFLGEHDWKLISMPNNAFAAKKVADEGDKSQAAIASELAAEVYGLDILEKGVNSAENNSTRFIIVTGQKVYREDAGKISICFEVPHESGSLYNCLGHFIFNGLNISKIESRPIEGRTWEYRFFLDFDGNLSDPSVRCALTGLREEARYLRVLGNY